MFRALVIAAVIGIPCSSPDSGSSPHGSGPSATPAGTRASSSGGPDREPADLVRYAEESTVIDAIVAAGFEVDQVRASKFEEHFFAEWKRGRVFYNSYSKPSPFRVDALFLDSPPGAVRVCPVPGSAYDYSVVRDGRAATMGATAQVFFAFGDRHFVMTSEPAIHASLIARLGLSVPTC
jgi:hypothetical protein